MLGTRCQCGAPATTMWPSDPAYAEPTCNACVERALDGAVYLTSADEAYLRGGEHPGALEAEDRRIRREWEAGERRRRPRTRTSVRGVRFARSRRRVDAGDELPF